MAVSTFAPEDRPQLRWPLDISPIDEAGKSQYLFRDPLGVASESLVIPGPLIPIISRFDGTRSIREIATDGAAHGVTLELVLAIAQTLSQHYFLLTTGFEERFSENATTFRQSPLREAVHAGKVYPDDPMALRAVLDKYLRDVPEVPLSGSSLDRVCAFISPHIDYHRGWKTYAAGFKALQRIHPPDVIFLLGTAHQPGEGIFHFTKKAFATPFGPIPCATEVVDGIVQQIGAERAYRSELLHRQEHSLELQLPFLHHRFADHYRPDSNQPQPALVPILVGSFHEYLLRGQEPQEHGEASDVIGALAESIKSLKAQGKKALFHGGVDLAHVGLQFGDKIRVSDTGLTLVESRDRELLDHILRGDERGLFGHIAADLDQRRICGFPSIYTMLSALRLAGISVRGHLIEYRQAVEPRSDCVVTFASAIWEEI